MARINQKDVNAVAYKAEKVAVWKRKGVKFGASYTKAAKAAQPMPSKARSSKPRKSAAPKGTGGTV